VYLILKTIHILSVVLFLGNIITGIFWKGRADATDDPRLQAHAMAGIIRSDAWFTIPSVLVIIASGVALASMAGLPLIGTRWIALSLLAFGASGILFVAYLGPAQKRLLNMAHEAEAGPDGGWPSPAYKRLSLRWEVVGIIAIILPLAALALMVFKPAFLF
jgi:uncharacterized membrane protein